MKNLITITLMMLLTGIFATRSNAQATDTVKILKLAADLSISKQKALRLYRAINYPVDVNAIMASPTMTMAQKQSRLQYLLDQKRRRVDSVLTPVQQALFMRREGALRGHRAAALTDVQQLHETQMNAVPHQHVTLSAIGADTTKKKN